MHKVKGMDWHHDPSQNRTNNKTISQKPGFYVVNSAIWVPVHARFFLCVRIVVLGVDW